MSDCKWLYLIKVTYTTVESDYWLCAVDFLMHLLLDVIRWWQLIKDCYPLEVIFFSSMCSKTLSYIQFIRSPMFLACIISMHLVFFLPLNTIFKVSWHLSLIRKEYLCFQFLPLTAVLICLLLHIICDVFYYLPVL